MAVISRSPSRRRRHCLRLLLLRQPVFRRRRLVAVSYNERERVYPTPSRV